MARISHAGGVASELFRLRAENAELRKLPRVVKHLRQVVDEQARETLELRRALYREKGRKRQLSGRRRTDAGHADRKLVGAPSGASAAD